jgi:nuclear polyadenylated RNA-binding protein NAB2
LRWFEIVMRFDRLSHLPPQPSKLESFHQFQDHFRHLYQLSQPLTVAKEEGTLQVTLINSVHSSLESVIVDQTKARSVNRPFLAQATFASQPPSCNLITTSHTLFTMSTIVLDTPLAASLSTAVHARIVEEGWTQDDDTSLAEYIVLMLANGKTQDQIASELAGELLQDAKGTPEFAQWLFDQVNILSGGASVSAPTPQQPEPSAPSSSMNVDSAEAESSIPAAYDTDMGDNAPENAYVTPHSRLAQRHLLTTFNSPRGPKGLHGGRPAGRGGRGGAITKASDSALHRTRGNDRIGGNKRGVPTGPRTGPSRDVRPGVQKALNGMMGGPGGMQHPMTMNGQQGPMMQMSPQQQMEMLAMFEQQTRLMAQMTGQMMPSPTGNGFAQGQQNGQGRSLFDRIDGRGRGGGRGRGRGGVQNGHIKSPNKTSDSDTVMEGGDQTGVETASVDMQSVADSEKKPLDPSMTMCHFNLRCTNADCAYVHQSPAAPEGTLVDMSESCTFGPACKNAKCVLKHPSPAKVKAFQAQETCKFFPNCTKPNCPFKHPSMPMCKFGGSCKTENCPFTHLQTPCRFNPCTNLRCPFKHEPGQQKINNFADYTWTPDKAATANQSSETDHVSDRKFVDDQAGEEELIKPEEQQQQQEVIT